MRTMAVSYEYNQFVQSERYQMLPDELEDGEQAVSITIYLENDDPIGDPVQFLNNLFAEYGVSAPENSEARPLNIETWYDHTKTVT